MKEFKYKNAFLPLTRIRSSFHEDSRNELILRQSLIPICTFTYKYALSSWRYISSRHGIEIQFNNPLFTYLVYPQSTLDSSSGRLGKAIKHPVHKKSKEWTERLWLNIASLGDQWQIVPSQLLLLFKVTSNPLAQFCTWAHLLFNLTTYNELQWCSTSKHEAAFHILVNEVIPSTCIKYTERSGQVYWHNVTLLQHIHSQSLESVDSAWTAIEKQNFGGGSIDKNRSIVIENNINF